VIVVDDTSEVPIVSAFADLPAPVANRVRLIRHERREGCIVARNTMVREARTEYVLLLDDDAALISRATVVDALHLLEAHSRVGGVACAAAERDGSPWHPAMQPAPVDYTCYVTTFIGFAHILRRSLFVELTGYRESFYFYGEEKDYCLRVLDAGFNIVYMPSLRVIHAPDPSGRSQSKYLRYVIRNDCLFALYNEPLPMAILTLPIRLGRYLKMRRGAENRGDFAWIVGELARRLPSIVRGRRPVSWATVRRWRHLGRSWPAFPLVGTHA
jgi:GT2 family glycosyltransferase